MSPAFAFLHHVAAFALVAALAVEFVLLRDELNLKSARRLLAADAIYGASAVLVLVIGTLRVLYFEKGGAYYIHSVPFIAKIALFVCIGLLSITPTREFLSWRKSLREGRVPQLDAGKLRKLRSIIHLELAGIVLLILCAALMARGVGYFG
jgi:putative membrane protein